MKLAYLLSLSLFLSACLMPPVPQPKGDDTTDDPKESSVYPGEWSYSNIVMSNGSLMAGQQSFGTFTGTGKDIQGSFSIKEDGTFTTTLAYTAAVQLQVFNQTIPQEVPVQERTISGTWTETGGKISFDASDGSEVSVSSSNASQIVFSGEFMEQLSLGQFTLDATADVEFTLSK